MHQNDSLADGCRPGGGTDGSDDLGTHVFRVGTSVVVKNRISIDESPSELSTCF